MLLRCPSQGGGVRENADRVGRLGRRRRPIHPGGCTPARGPNGDPEAWPLWPTLLARWHSSDSAPRSLCSFEPAVRGSATDLGLRGPGCVVPGGAWRVPSGALSQSSPPGGCTHGCRPWEPEAGGAISLRCPVAVLSTRGVGRTGADRGEVSRGLVLSQVLRRRPLHPEGCTHEGRPRGSEAGGSFSGAPSSSSPPGGLHARVQTVKVARGPKASHRCPCFPPGAGVRVVTHRRDLEG